MINNNFVLFRSIQKAPFLQKVILLTDQGNDDMKSFGRNRNLSQNMYKRLKCCHIILINLKDSLKDIYLCHIHM